MTAHTYYKCPGDKPECEEGRCNYCQGGLSYCTTCGGAEITLATECPGKTLTDAQADCLINGRADYRDGQWVDLTDICMCGCKMGEGDCHAGMCMSMVHYYLRDK